MYQNHNERFSGRNTYSKNYFFCNLNELFGDLCEEAKQIAKEKGAKSTKDWLYKAEKLEMISTSERICFSKLIETRNLKDHGGSQYLKVTSKAIHDIKTLIRKMNPPVNVETYQSQNTTAFRSQQKYLGNMTRSFARKSSVDGKIYRFELAIVKTHNYGFVVNINHAPQWNKVTRNFRDFQIVSSEKGCHIYTPAVLSTLDEADKLINVWVNRYVQKLDNLKRYQN